MSPKSMLLQICLLLYGIIGTAQYTEKINTNRPGTSQGAFAVGNNVLQFEGGIGFGKQNHELFNTKTNTFGVDYALRYGLFFEQLEIRINGRYRADGTQSTTVNIPKERESNFQFNTIGAKFLFFDPNKRKLKKEIEERKKEAKLFGQEEQPLNQEGEEEQAGPVSLNPEEETDTEEDIEEKIDPVDEALEDLEMDKDLETVNRRIPDPTGRDSTGIEVVYDYKNRKVDNGDLLSWKKRHRFRWKSLIPAMSAYVGVNYITENNPFVSEGVEGISPKVVFATQNNWSTRLNGDWVLVTNLILDQIATDDMIIGWIITSTHTIKEKWAVFGEFQGQKSDFYSDNIMRVGSAYLFNKDFQIDANVAFNFKDTPSVLNFSVGASYRFDWHKKDEIIDKTGLKAGVQEKEKDEDGKDNEEDLELHEFEEVKSDSLKMARTPFINMFEDDDEFRTKIDQDLDKKWTDERVERERIAAEKLSKKEQKKLDKEERRRKKREAKAARLAEKAKAKEEKQKQKMINEIDAELNKIEKDEGLDMELDELDKELQKLEQMDENLDSLDPNAIPEIPEEKVIEEQPEVKTEDPIDENLKKEQEKLAKEEEKRRKKEEKKRLKEEKKRKKEEEKRNKEESENNGE